MSCFRLQAHHMTTYICFHFIFLVRIYWYYSQITQGETMLENRSKGRSKREIQGLHVSQTLIHSVLWAVSGMQIRLSDSFFSHRMFADSCFFFLQHTTIILIFHTISLISPVSPLFFQNEQRHFHCGSAYPSLSVDLIPSHASAVSEKFPLSSKTSHLLISPNL